MGQYQYVKYTDHDATHVCINTPLAVSVGLGGFDATLMVEERDGDVVALSWADCGDYPRDENGNYLHMSKPEFRGAVESTLNGFRFDWANAAIEGFFVWVPVEWVG